MPWIRFFPSDWLAGTRGMSAVETGVYITLIATMYERGEPIPEDHARLARLCGASNSSFAKAIETLVDEGKIVRVGGGLWNDRVEKEQVYLSEKSEVGSRAARARWNKKDNENNDSGDADALPTQSLGNANQKPEARTINNSSSLRSEDAAQAPRKRAHRMPDDFQPDLDYAVGEGLTISEAKSEVEAMRDWSKSSPKGAKLDWPATWRGWVRRAVQSKPRRQAQAPPRESDHARHQRECREAIQQKLNGNQGHDEFASSGPAFDLEPGDYRTH